MNPAESSTGSRADAAVDAALRDIALPAGLAERLRLPALFDDRAVDRLLGDVPLPAGLAARLRHRSAAPQEPSMGWRPGGAAIVRGAQRWLRAVARDGLAVAFALGMVATMFLAGLKVAEWAQVPGRARPRSVPADASRFGAGGATRAPVDHREDHRVATGPAEQTTQPGAGVRPSPAAAAVAIPARSRPPVVRAAPLPLAAEAQPAAGGRFPGMRVVPGESPDAAAAFRRSVPGMRGFDLAFEMAYGEAPFVDPSLASGLGVDRPPLVVGTDSFDRIWPLPAGRRRRAELAALRVEHLLAALSNPPVAEGDPAAVRLAAVRSLRPGRPTYLLEVSVHVPPATGRRDVVSPAADATLVIDHSAAPGATSLWVSVCRGLTAAAARMTPLDRLTVVVAEPRPRVVAIRASADDIRRLATELEEESPFGIANLDAAVAAARVLTAREGVTGRLVVVAHAERAEQCIGAGREALNGWREAVRRGEPADPAPSFLLISGVPDGSSPAVAGMPGWTLSDPTGVRRRLVDLLATAPGALVDGVQLEVTFDPALIAAYRLVGHRQSVPESLAAFDRPRAADAGVTLHGGESVRVVYEVVPRQPPRGRLDGVAATLTCRTESGAVRSVAARSAVLDPAPGGLPSAAGCELTLAVAVGEFPGRSIHAVPKPASLEGVRGMAAAWGKRGDVTAVGRRLLALFDDLAAGAGGAVSR